MIVVDTHIIIWDALKPESLSQKAKNTIDEANKKDGIIICEVSLWEIAMLIKKKRLEIEIPYLEFIDLVISSNNYILKGITPTIADLSVNLPKEVNQDPADRLICATSIAHKAPLITADRNLLNSKYIKTIW
ncbi:MAG: type II toxin-antitoxin system VapC family toxin [Bacteroidetes bacterium]|nr:MAG: type II toxin-antitoxin system VapC family toxin [Bacteroidota bacterium]